MAKWGVGVLKKKVRSKGGGVPIKSIRKRTGRRWALQRTSYAHVIYNGNYLRSMLNK